MHKNMIIIMQLFEAIFQSKAANTDITQVRIANPNLANGFAVGRWFRDSTTGEQSLRGFDFDVIDNGRILNLRILEQNPNKRDFAGNVKHFANLARQGHQICWVIDRNGSFLGRVHNGQWHFSQPRATMPVQQPTNQYATAAAMTQPTEAPQTEPMNWDVDMIPDIPSHADVPETVLNHFANIDEEPPDDYDQ